MAEINRLAAEPPSAEEFEGNPGVSFRAVHFAQLSRGALISQLQNVDTLGLGEDYLKTYVAR